MTRHGPAEWVLEHRPEGTVGFGLGGNEVGVPGERYRDAFDLARDGGLHLVARGRAR